MFREMTDISEQTVTAKKHSFHRTWYQREFQLDEDFFFFLQWTSWEALFRACISIRRTRFFHYTLLMSFTLIWWKTSNLHGISGKLKINHIPAFLQKAEVKCVYKVKCDTRNLHHRPQKHKPRELKEKEKIMAKRWNVSSHSSWL